MTSTYTNFMLIAVIVSMVFGSFPETVSAQRPMGRAYERYDDMPEVMSEPRKRPFCNAFTGCGRKRSSPPQQQLIQDQPAFRKVNDIMDDSMETLIGMSSEPAVEDLSRQIMSEAKLWEAIQEASAELARRRTKAGH